MAAATITIVVRCGRDQVAAKHASHPENFHNLGQAVVDLLTKQLGPDAGQQVTISSITVT